MDWMLKWPEDLFSISNKMWFFKPFSDFWISCVLNTLGVTIFGERKKIGNYFGSLGAQMLLISGLQQLWVMIIKKKNKAASLGWKKYTGEPQANNGSCKDVDLEAIFKNIHNEYILQFFLCVCVCLNRFIFIIIVYWLLFFLNTVLSD